MTNNRGFSLIELTVAVALLGFLAVLGVLSLKRGTHQAGSRALANTVAAALSEARERAVASGCPVAIGFPSDGGTAPLTSSLYRLEGATTPALVSSQSFSGDFPNVFIFNGLWATDSSTFRNIGSSPQANPVPPGSVWSNYQNLSLWLPSFASKDYCYLFRPDGSVVSNQMVAFDGAYHILVTSGQGSWTGPATLAGSAPLYTPTVLGETFSISLALNGSLRVDTGVPGAASGLITFVDSGTSSNFNAPAPPLVGATALPAPSLLALTMLSNEAGSGGPLPPSISVGVDGYVTLDTLAADTASTGQRLYANWTVTAAADNGGKGVSGYSVPLPSAPGGQCMDWDPAASGGTGAWHSVWGWRPPYDAAPGDRFTLGLVIQDSLGLNRTAQVQRFISIAPPGKLLSSLAQYSLGGNTLYKLNSDGTFPVAQAIANTVPLPAGWTAPNLWQADYFSASADGSRIALRTTRSLPFPTRYTAVSEPTFSSLQMLPGAGQILQSISPAGDLVAYVEYGDPTYLPRGAGALYVQEVAGLGRRVLLDPDVGFCVLDNGGGPVDAFPGMIYRMFTDRITWDPTGGDNNEWTLYYSAFGSAALDTPLGRYNPTPQIRTCTVVADALAGPRQKTAPSAVTSPNLTGAYAPNIPSYATAPYEMTFVKWNGGVANNKTISLWNMTDPANPIYDQALPPGLYQSPLLVPKNGRAGQDSIVCAQDVNFSYDGYIDAMGLNARVNLSRFTPNLSGAPITDLQQITSIDPAQGFVIQPTYTPISY